MIKRLTMALMACLLLAPLALGGCGEKAASGEGFAIYLTGNDIPPSKMEMQSHLEIADEPVISLDDIVSYQWDTHEIELTAEAFTRVIQMKIPVSGLSFVVCVDKGPVYWGAFWTPISSQSFGGVTIMTQSPFPGGDTVTLELGYPSPGFYNGEDPRSNPEIRASLEQAGKLK
ncbi:MAG: hypothetical protein WC370_11180 [Dehalococcoidales bacterium]|jgi:hypothetical protein